MITLTTIITSPDPAIRDQPLDPLCRGATARELLTACAELEQLRHSSENLYHRVRALFFLYAIHRFYLPNAVGVAPRGMIPYEGYTHLLNRRFEEAIRVFSSQLRADGPTDAICSALAAAYHRLAFQTLADQVRRSVRQVRGNQWMFRVGHPADQPLRVRGELVGAQQARRVVSPRDALGAPQPGVSHPILRESTPVRMDLTHSGWSDIFFLGMDYPEGARVLNVSIDLGVRGRDTHPRPPVEAYFRVIDEPLLRLSSVDLGATADISELSEVFDFARDHLGLLKAAVIAAGLVPPGIEGSGQSLADLLAQMVGPGRGIELVSQVNDIPKGSRLAVSTNLLAALIAVCMRATGQAATLTGPLSEDERRVVLARAVLGEWLGGSGGGWQDSGGVWPGMKIIQGVLAAEGDPEWGVSRGRLMPQHHVLTRDQVSDATRQALQDSLVLVHGGMAQNVGPILEMVSEKYLLRSEHEWSGRAAAIGILDQILAALRAGDIATVGALTTHNFFGPIQTIIPWASNLYTEQLIAQAQSAFGGDFWGFWMLGGMSGGGMGFIFDPRRKAEAQERMFEIMRATKRRLETALPFAMDPVVYDFAINERGTYATLLQGADALMPAGYYALTVPAMLRADPRTLAASRRAELDHFGEAVRTRPELASMVPRLFDLLLPRGRRAGEDAQSLAALLDQNGFDRLQHEQIRIDLRNGRIGLMQNRLPATSSIRDVEPGDVTDALVGLPAQLGERGLAALRRGEVAVVTLAAGAGSRWTQGAGVVKALHPFAKLGGRHRSFVETHLAKSRQVSREVGVDIPHVFTTSYLTHGPTAAYLEHEQNYGYAGSLLLSPGRSIGLRLIPMARDLRFAWQETAHQVLDVQAQKVRESGHAALIGWAEQSGEGDDYTDNLPAQCLHPTGHWFELPNMLRNGTLAMLLEQRPQLRYLMLHNIDTLGANVDAALLGLHIERGAALSFEVITRRLEDRGGGLARVDGQLRLLEGLAMPREQDEFALSYYNTLTTWIEIDQLLRAFGLSRADLRDQAKVTVAVRALGARLPTYITLKDVKKRWGHGQEDTFPVVQFEKLWGDMSALPDLNCAFVAVPRGRGHQLKDQAQLDGWLRDGSAAYVEGLCAW
ncbi:MAG: UTP--glucose-1-phosphate uridylyltransferase [Roseiflexaceae bacterium]|nr:UTP--glucose-1-phosphate uridylyltransferase [Roseiflexaceae bacterium]